MVRRPTAHSVTDVPCRCGYLQRESEEPATPILFDEEMHEFHIAHQNGGYAVIYHCPWCGGVGPRSKRARFFATITNAESERLQRLTSGLTSVEEAIARLGKPDGQDVRGTTILTPATRREPPTVRTYRTLRFSKLSDTAEVTLIDYGPKGIGFSFQGKPLRKASVRGRSRARRAASSAGRRSKRARRSS
jgi:hypothetical protein